MKINFLAVGKIHESYIKNGVEEFTGRISNYFPVEWTIIPVPKNVSTMSEANWKKKKER